MAGTIRPLAKVASLACLLGCLARDQPVSHAANERRLSRTWGNATPTVPADMTVTAFATGLHDVRSVFVLLNGDVLAVEPKGPSEPIARPKDILVNWIERFGHSDTSGRDEFTLLRDTNGDGRADVKTVFVDHLVSPFGVALIGGDGAVSLMRIRLHQMHVGL